MSEKAMTITYPVKNGIYVNMTNRCNCACTFCIRFQNSGVYGSDPLWLEHEPTVEETIASLKTWNLAEKDEIVFCGYGEPTKRLEDLLEVAAWIKANTSLPVRLNTNGLACLEYGKDVTPLLAGKIDCVSISLNADTKEKYLAVTRPEFGEAAWEAMKAFAHECTKHVPDVVMTVVDQVTTPEEQKNAAELCRELGVRLRVREYVG